MVSLDTNAVLALLLGDNPDRLTKVTELLKQNTCFVSELAFAELEHVLRADQQMSRQQVTVNINAIVAHPKIKCNTALITEALGMYAESPALSFVDCCLVTEAKIDKRYPLYTFDNKLADQAGELANYLYN